MTTTQTEEIQAQLDQAREAVEAADAAWEAELDNTELKRAYDEAKVAFRAIEADAIAIAHSVECGRCGGTGKVEWGIGDKTCFRCLGYKVVAYRPHKFDANPKIRAKRSAEYDAKRQAEQAAYDAKLEQLPADVAHALVAAEQKFNDFGGFYSADGQELSREESFRYELACKLRKYDSLSEKQIAAVQRGIERDAQKAAEAEALKTAPPLEGGKREIVGEILSTKVQHGNYGSTFKMLVKLADGNKVYGSVPRKLEDLTTGDFDQTTGQYIEPAYSELRGLRVKFSATVERSADDDHFGFFSRPTKPEVLA